MSLLHAGFPDMEVNFKRTLALLDLSIEQLRLVNPATAGYVRSQHYATLKSIFSSVLSSDEYRELINAGDHTHYLGYLESQAREQLRQQGQAPPGLGAGVFDERVPPPLQPAATLPLPSGRWEGLGVTPNRTPARSVPSTYGAIGDGKPRPKASSEHQPAHTKTALSALPGKVSDLLGSINDGAANPHKSKSHRTSPSRQSDLDSIPEDVEPLEDFPMFPFPQPALNAADMQSPSHGGVSVRQANERATATSGKTWATVAQMPSPALAPTPAPRQTRALAPDSCSPRQSRQLSAVSTASDPPEEQARVVWVLGLPRAFTMHNLSFVITVGPVLSICFSEDAAPDVPGRAACVVFRNATSARLFAEMNTPTTPHPADDGFDEDDDKEDDEDDGNNNDGNSNAFPESPPPSPATRSTAPATFGNALFLPHAPAASVRFGAPYPIAGDPHLAMMDPPEGARRRLKWARARLFYDVRLEVFKRDVLKLVGGQAQVECFHFYNPGEATVVFASVAVARVVLDAFAAYREALLAERASSSSSSSAPSASLAPTTTTTARNPQQQQQQQRGKEGKKSGSGGGGGGNGNGNGNGNGGPGYPSSSSSRLLKIRLLGEGGGEWTPEGRYGADVDVSYAKDWNESPPERVSSQYGRTKQGGIGRNVEGLFSGPVVRLSDL